MNRFKLNKCFSFILILISILMFVACSKPTVNKTDEPKETVTETLVTVPEETVPTDTETILPTEIILEKSSYKIMEGTTLETTVYVFKSNVKGPTVFITGGTHGDEVAGWKTALELLNRDDYRGTVIIIPRLNYLATQLQTRYPGVNNSGVYNGIKYSDLNRSFPGKVDGTITEQLAHAIVLQLNKYNPDYVIDLHESRCSYSEEKGSLLGDQLLYANAKSALMCEDLIDIYNKNYAEAGDVPFGFDGPGVQNSLNNYYGMTLKCKGFTVETNRKLELDKRITQQLNIIDCFFNYIWNN